MSEELKPCPFCGEDAAKITTGYFSGEYWVRCDSCGVTTKSFWVNFSAKKPDGLCFNQLDLISAEKFGKKNGLDIEGPKNAAMEAWNRRIAECQKN